MIDEITPGTKWRHRNGSVYEIVMLTNTDSTHSEYPVTVVYRGANGKVWSRPVSDWERSFTSEPMELSLREKIEAAIKEANEKGGNFSFFGNRPRKS